MKRQIKFRGKDIKTGYWRYGYYIYDDNYGSHSIYFQKNILPTINDPIGSHTIVEREVDPNTVGQYTGFKDSKGKEVYEGDVIKTNNGIGVVYYEDFTWYGAGDYLHNISEYYPEVEVLGNVYDNPELLDNID